MSKQKEIKKHESAKKQDGTLKKKYKDMPRFKAIYGYENQFKSSYDKILRNMTMEISKTLVGFSKKNKKN